MLGLRMPIGLGAIALISISVLISAVWSPPSMAGEMVRTSIPSKSLGRPLQTVVYLPDGYDTSGHRYPVLYLLHGAGGDESSWSESGGIKERIDGFIASGIIPPTLIVMPGCRECWWIDGPRDKAESAIIEDLLPAIAQRFRAIDARRGRVVAGLSAGGYGAVRFALKYPHLFAAGAAFSPAVYSESPPAQSAARQHPPFLKADGSFDQARWTALNYPTMLEAYFQRRLSVPLFLVSGDGDRFGIAFETALLFKRLFDRQPDITELRVVDGDHTWDVWANAIDRALPFLYQYAAQPERIEEPASPPTSSTDQPSRPAVLARRR